MANGSANQPVSVTRLTIPLVLVCGLLAGVVVLPVNNLYGRVDRLERLSDRENFEAVAHDMASFRRELDALRREIDKNDERSKERHLEQRRAYERITTGLAEQIRILDTDDK
jgi:predicted phage tail protein